MNTSTPVSSLQGSAVRLSAHIRRAGYTSRTNLKNMLLAGAFSLLAFASHSQATLLTSFEEGEGFALGSINGQAGWTGPTGANTMSVSAAQAKDGIWSLAVPAGTSKADSPDLLASGFASLSYWVKADGTTPSGIYSRVRILLSDSNTTTATLEFNIRRNGANYQISYWTWDAGNVRTTTWANLSSYSPFDWNEISFDFASESKTYSLSINDGMIATGLTLPTAVTATDAISQIQFLNHASGDFTGTAYYDGVTAAVPEPTTSALLMIVIAAGVLRRRMKSR